MSKYARDGIWQTKGLTPRQRCILLAIAEECEDGSESKPVTQDALAAMCECTPLWVWKEIHKLQDRGILEIMSPSAGEGHQACIYRIVHPDVRHDAEEMQPAAKEAEEKDPLWLKKKRSGSKSSGGTSHARKAGRFVNANGQGLVAIGLLIRS